MNAFRRGFAASCAAFMFFALLALVLTYPLVLHLGDHLRDDGDSYEYAWVLGFGAYQLAHHPFHLFDGNIFYPFPLSLAYSDSTIPNVMLSAPIIWLTSNPVLALNLMILLTFVLGGFGVYLLLRDRTGSTTAAVVAGIMYGFSPYRYDHLAQLPNVSMEWAPFALWSFDRYLATGRFRWAAGFATFCVLQVLVSFYYAFILGLGIAIYVVVRLVEHAGALRNIRWIGPLVGCCVLGAVVTTPFVLPYFTVERDFGLQRTIQEATFFSAWPANFLAPTATLRVVLIQPLLGLLHTLWSNLPIVASERRLYPGLLIVLLAVVGLWRSRWTRWLAPVGMILSGIALSFGPFFHPTRDVVLSLPFPMPYAILYDYLPGFTALRVPSRFAALVLLGLAILAGDGLTNLQSRLATLKREDLHAAGQRIALLATFGCATIAIIEGANSYVLTPVRTGAAVPQVYRWLAVQTVPSPVVELPIDDNAFHESPRAYYSTYDHQPLVDGFRSFIPPGYSGLAKTIATFPSRQAVDTLRRLAVRYVVVHESELPPASKIPPGVAIAGIQSVAQFGTDDVYEVSGTPAPEALQLQVTRPGCLARTGVLGNLAIGLAPGDTALTLVLPPQTHEIAFRLDWQGKSGAAYREVTRFALSTWVLTLPTQVTVPYHVPPEADVYTLTVSLVEPPGLTAETVIPLVTVGSTATVTGTTTPWLASARLTMARARATSGPIYELVWQFTQKSSEPMVAFIDAYDDQGQYWSWASGKEERFDQPPSCPNALVLETEQLILRPDTPPGKYWVEVGIMNPDTSQRIPFVGPDGKMVSRVAVGSFWVLPTNVFPAGALPEPTEAGTSFGSSITLQSLSVAGSVEPSGSLRVGLRWTARKAMPVDYTVFIHLTDSAGRLLTQYDSQPSSVYPTSAWLPGDTLVEEATLSLPASLPPGPYQVQVGLYDLQTMQRLPVVDDSGRVVSDHIVAIVDR